MSTNPLQQLTEAGVSIWLDDLSRERLETGNLADLMKNSNVVGVTTNPSIFQAALADGERYDEQVRELAAVRAPTCDAAARDITTDDVRDACRVLRPVFDATDGVDGRVSIEVSPGVAHDTDATVKEAAELWERSGEPNLFVKIPGTPEGWPAITETLGERDLRQRDADLRSRPVPARHGGLRRRAREGRGERPRPVDPPLGGVLLRLPRRHRDRQAARGDHLGSRHRSRPTRQGGRGQRPAGVPDVRGVLRRRALGGAGGRRAPASSARCGPRPA